MRELQQQTLAKDDELRQLRAELNEKNLLIQHMENTFSWKVTKPLRMLRNLKIFKCHWSYQDASWKGKFLRFCAKTFWPKRLILQSGLFDQEYYLKHNPDVAQAGVDPLRHFLRHGGFEGRKPHPDFDTTYYLQNYTDVQESSLNPLLHYLLYGNYEGRLPNRDFIEFPIIRHSQSDQLHNKFVSFILTKLHLFLFSGYKFVFPKEEHPVLTIILVLFNRAELTFQCLESIKLYADVPYQIIIVDNASHDNTSLLLKSLQNVVIIQNAENVGFLKACNQAIEVAQGKYVLFLNNDTQIFPYTLSLLVNTIEANPKIGVVGGKIIFSNGTLQEAGSIIWKDGSYWKYGMGDCAENPEYSYVKEVYFCSLDLLLTQRTLFMKLEMFDEIYDSLDFAAMDYCMKIRDNDRKVIYQPLAQVMRYEFLTSQKINPINNSNDNQRKFVEKWMNIICEYYAVNEKNILLAREYHVQRHPKRMLFIDDIVPLPQLGSGYPRSYFILKGLIEMGYSITIFPILDAITFPNFRGILSQAQYEAILVDFQQQQVEIINNHPKGKFHHTSETFYSFLKERIGYYDIIFVNRPQNMKIVKDVLTHYKAEAKIIYDAEAIAVMREMKYLEVNGKILEARQKESLLREEIELSRIADSVIAVSNSEQRTFEQFGILNVHRVSHVLQTNPTPLKFEQRKDILFVGSINSSEPNNPNYDAIKYFLTKIYPIIQRELDCELYIVGSIRATDILHLNLPHVSIIGQVDNLFDYYNTCRVFVIPTRFSAGIALKLLEASSFGLPSVTTPLIAAQLEWEDRRDILVGQDADDFAQKVIELYTNESLWEQLRENALKKIETDFNKTVVMDALRKVFFSVENRPSSIIRVASASQSLPADYNQLRLLAFYLPQFHPIPENNEWWGEGFTEWYNVVKARPMFKNHYQPKLPAGLGFYDLRVPETRIAQAEIARKYGIEGFCYWHYWFGGGRRILERPFHEVLTSKEPNFPFCLGWANESWTGIWHGAANRILMEQTYPGKQDYELHFQYLIEAFSDERYITVDEKPVFFVFQPLQLPNMQEFTDTFRELAYRSGLKGLYLIANQNVNEQWNPTQYGFDAMNCSNHAVIMFVEPDNHVKRLSFNECDVPFHVYEYQKAMKYFVFSEKFNFEYYPSIIPGWDNTPRSGLKGLVLHDSTPEYFKVHVKEAFNRVKHLPPKHRIVFIKSWNEWAEGNYMEPDQRYGYAYLEGLKDEILTFQESLSYLTHE